MSLASMDFIYDLHFRRAVFILLSLRYLWSGSMMDAMRSGQSNVAGWWRPLVSAVEVGFGRSFSPRFQSSWFIQHPALKNSHSSLFTMYTNCAFICDLYCRILGPSISNLQWPRKGEHDMSSAHYCSARIVMKETHAFHCVLKSPWWLFSSHLTV